MGIVLLVGTVGAGVAGVAASTRGGDALPEACTLPGPVPCSVSGDPNCTQYGAACDTNVLECVCPGGDLGTDLGNDDLAGRDLAPTPSGDGGGTGGTPPVGGGMTSPPKSAGCSFVPGSR